MIDVLSLYRGVGFGLRLLPVAIAMNVELHCPTVAVWFLRCARCALPPFLLV
jgi:hypothetical protein